LLIKDYLKKINKMFAQKHCLVGLYKYSAWDKSNQPEDRLNLYGWWNNYTQINIVQIFSWGQSSATNKDNSLRLMTTNRISGITSRRMRDWVQSFLWGRVRTCCGPLWLSAVWRTPRCVMQTCVHTCMRLVFHVLCLQVLLTRNRC
jgi:hypothetical protein